MMEHNGPHRMRNRLWVFFLIYFFFWMGSNTLEPYLGLFYETRGLSGTQIGLASTVFSLATVLASLTVGPLEDHVGRPGGMIGLLVTGMILATGVLFLGHTAAVILPAVFCYGFCYSPINGITDKVLLDELQTQSDRFSRLRMGGTGGAAAGVLLAALLVKDDSFLTVFCAFWLLMTLCGLCAWRMPQEHQSPPQVTHWKDYADLVKSPYFLPIYMTLAVWGFAESGVHQFLALHISHVGLSARMTSVFIAAAMGGELLGFNLMPCLSSSLRHRTLLGLAFFLQTLRLGSLALLSVLPVPVVLLFQFTGGASFALLYSTITAVIGLVYPSKISYSAHSLKLIANRGIGVSTGMMLLGVLFDRGLPVLGYAILSAAACVPLLFYLLPIRRDKIL